MQEGQPYKGPVRKLVLAFDVGTTHGRVSYGILDPGEPPFIYDVHRFPATDRVGGSHKTPCIVYYDADGIPRAFGSEALLESVIEKAEEEGWTKAERWKLHLRPRTMEFSDRDLPPLPPNKTAIQVLGDFLGYLFWCAKIYIEETQGGRDMWASFGENINFVLCHPNGWEGPQQAQIRRAAVLAGLIPDSPEGQARVKLVTEGEAIVHFCLSCKKTAGSFKGDQGVMIIGAGSKTINVSSYYMVTSPFTLQEIAPTQCCMEGAASVTRRAQDFLTVKLAGSKFGTPDDIAYIASKFDKTTTYSFSNPSNSSYIYFRGPRDSDPAFNIKSGNLKIAGADVATFFEPSVRAIIAAVDNQRRVATKDISSIFLVGSFAANDWLFSKLQEHIKSLRLNFCRPDGHTGRVVSNGAVAALLQSYERGQEDQEDEVAMHQVLHREEDEKGGAPSQNQRLAEELDDLRHQLESKDAELRNFQNELQHSQRPEHEDESLTERLPRLKASHQRPVDQSTTLSQSQQLIGELDNLRRQLESKDVELKNLRNEFQRSERSDYEQESVKGAANETQKPKERLPRLKTSCQGPVDEPATLSQSFKREQEDNAAMQQTLHQEEDEKVKVLSRNMGDSLKHQPENIDVELKDLRNELQRLQRLADKQKSLKGVADENQKPKERLPRLKAFHQRTVDESTALSQSPEREQEAKVVMQQALGQGEDDVSRAPSQDRRVTEELGELRSQLESKEVELRNIWNPLRCEEEMLEEAARENQMLKEVVQLRASYQNAIDEYTTLSQSLKKDKVAMRESLRREEDEKGEALSQIQRLTGELDDLRRQVQSHEAELRNLRSAVREKEFLKGAAEENLILKEQLARLTASRQKAIESTALAQARAGGQGSSAIVPVSRGG